MHQKAFSLVELSVVLAVISLTIGGALSLATKKTYADYENETLVRMEAIHKAISYHVSQNGRIPCPSDGTDTMLDSLLGEEISCASSRFSNGNIRGGVVPVRTLNLPDEYILDGWGRRFSYVMDVRFDDAANFRSNANGDIIVRNTEGGAVTNSNVVYLLISHGLNGYGAYRRDGGSARLAYPTASDDDEKTNSGDDLSSFDANFVQKERDDSYDDILQYRLKWHLVDAASGVSNEALCAEAATPATPCNNAANETVCEAMAALVDGWCYEAP